MIFIGAIEVAITTCPIASEATLNMGRFLLDAGLVVLSSSNVLLTLSVTALRKGLQL